MTNKLNLFKKPLKTFKRRKPIQVRGGILVLEYYKMVKIIIKDDSSYLLKNTL